VPRKPATAADVLAAFRLLPPAEQRDFCFDLMKEPGSVVRERVEVLVELFADLGARLKRLRLDRRRREAEHDGLLRLAEQMGHILDRFARKPREVARDAEIVRLRDQGKQTWRDIGLHFDIEPDAARKAYKRFKCRQKQ
jgi:hypothetical protein